MTSGEKIRHLRKVKGLTQAELGKLLNVSQATVQQYETGNPKPKTLKRIADVFGVPSSTLFNAEFYFNSDELKNFINELSTDFDKYTNSKISYLKYINPKLTERVSRLLDGITVLNENGIIEAGNYVEYLLLKQDKTKEDTKTDE